MNHWCLFRGTTPPNMDFSCPCGSPFGKNRVTEPQRKTSEPLSGGSFARGLTPEEAAKAAKEDATCKPDHSKSPCVNVSFLGNCIFAMTPNEYMIPGRLRFWVDPSLRLRVLGSLGPLL